MQNFLSCPRKFEFGQVEQLQRIKSGEDKNTFLGSAVHAGIAAALTGVFHTGKTDNMVQDALNGLTVFLSANTLPGKMIFDYTLRCNIRDTEYYAMVDDTRESAKKCLRYYVPKLGIGTDWAVVSLGMLGLGDRLEPAVEYKFEYELVPGKVVLTGIIDAVLQDMLTGEYVIFDWKTRGQFVSQDVAALDGQLQTYALALGAVGEKIQVQRVAQVQMKPVPPKPAALTPKGALSAAVNQATTWEEWCRTLPEGYKAADYAEKLKDSLHPESDFIELIESPVTAFSRYEAQQQMIKTARLIEFSIKFDNFPAVYSSNTCKYCDFKALCALHRYGNDFTGILAQKFEKKKPLTPEVERVYD